MPAGDERSRPLIVFAHSGRDWIRGSERCLLDLIAGIDRRRFRLLAICNAPQLAREIERLATESLHVARWPRTAVGALALRGSVLRLLRERGAALVHANSTRVLPAMYPAAYRLALPTVAHLHMPYFSSHEYHAHLARQCAVVVGVAENVVAPLRRGPMPSARVRVIHNAVDAGRLQEGCARALREELGIPPTAFVAASLGSLIARKRHDVTVRAVAAACRCGLDVHLLLCGGGEEEGALRTLATRLGVAGRVHLLGFRADPGAVLRDATDVLVASAEEEAFGLNVIEAEWLGVPVIASDVAGHREALSPDAGAIVPAGDPAALAARLVAVAADPAGRRAMADAGRAFATSRFRMASYVGAFEALYEELLVASGHSGGGPVDRGWPRTLRPWARAETDRRARKLRERLTGTRRLDSQRG